MMMRYLQYYTVTLVTISEQITNGENTIKFLKLGEEIGGDVAPQVIVNDDLYHILPVVNVVDVVISLLLVDM